MLFSPLPGLQERTVVFVSLWRHFVVGFGVAMQLIVHCSTVFVRRCCLYFCLFVCCVYKICIVVIVAGTEISAIMPDVIKQPCLFWVFYFPLFCHSVSYDVAATSWVKRCYPYKKFWNEVMSCDLIWRFMVCPCCVLSVSFTFYSSSSGTKTLNNERKVMPLYAIIILLMYKYELHNVRQQTSAGDVKSGFLDMKVFFYFFK